MVNLALFVTIVWRLAGPSRMFSILMVTALYPFASAAHFWQIMILHHVAITLFLLSVVLFLSVRRAQDQSTRRLWLIGFFGTVCFWLSLLTMEHAILTPILFWYLVRVDTGDGSSSPVASSSKRTATAIAACYSAVSLIVVLLLLWAGHPRLNFLSSATNNCVPTLALALHVPRSVAAATLLTLNGALFATATFFANTIGYLLYPLMTVVRHMRSGVGVHDPLLQVIVVSLVGVFGIVAARVSFIEESHHVESIRDRWLWKVGALWVVLACHAAMALGTLFGGWRIVKTMGMGITRIRPTGAFCAQTSGAATLFLATWMGIPVSTTHTITGAIVGVGLSRRVSAVRWGVAARIVWAWVLTIPAAGLIAALFWYLGRGFMG